MQAHAKSERKKNKKRKREAAEKAAEKAKEVAEAAEASGGPARLGNLVLKDAKMKNSFKAISLAEEWEKRGKLSAFHQQKLRAAMNEFFV